MNTVWKLIPGTSAAWTWVDTASSRLTSHPEFNDTQHGKGKGWRGHHFTALCFDQQGRRCRDGAGFMRANAEGAFPVWWIWPDQIAELIAPFSAAPDAPGEPVDATAQTVNVKPLEWLDGHTAITPFGSYGVYDERGYGRHYSLRIPVPQINNLSRGHERPQFDTPQAARTAAQADYENRILSALATEGK